MRACSSVSSASRASSRSEVDDSQNSTETVVGSVETICPNVVLVKTDCSTAVDVSDKLERERMGVAEHFFLCRRRLFLSEVLRSSADCCKSVGTTVSTVPMPSATVAESVVRTVRFCGAVVVGGTVGCVARP